MRLLLDTHALLWALAGDAALGDAARDLISDPANDVFVSVASLWEAVVKIRIGKLDVDADEMMAAVAESGFALLDIRPSHLVALARLPVHHRDPFDHLLIAQAVVEDLTFMSEDRNTPRYPVRYVTCSAARGSRAGAEL